MSHGKCPVAGEVRMPRGRRHVAGATRGQITCNERHNEEDQGMLALIRALPNLHSTSLLTMENPGTAPPGISRTSSSTAILSDPRVLLTNNSFAFRTVTCPMVGWLVFGRITAEATCKAKAFELAVEKVAEPIVSVAAGLTSSWANVAL